MPILNYKTDPGILSKAGASAAFKLKGFTSQSNMLSAFIAALA